MAGHLFFVFCAVDFLHSLDCSVLNGSPFSSDDGCAACQFKAGAHAELSTPLVFLNIDLKIEHKIPEVVERVQASDFSCPQAPRAPPA